MDVREKLVELLAKYFDIGDSYAYNLTRAKSAFACGTMGFDDFEEFDEETVADIADHLIANGVTVHEWISVDDRLPENSKKEGAFCPRYFVMTKYGESFGWYNPNFKSWFVLFWFFTDRLLEKEIDFERADVPRIVKVPDGVVTHWMPLPPFPKGGNMQ